MVLAGNMKKNSSSEMLIKEEISKSWNELLSIPSSEVMKHWEDSARTERLCASVMSFGFLSAIIYSLITVDNLKKENLFFGFITFLVSIAVLIYMHVKLKNTIREIKELESRRIELKAKIKRYESALNA